jgi:hypothetical protein
MLDPDPNPELYPDAIDLTCWIRIRIECGSTTLPAVGMSPTGEAPAAAGTPATAHLPLTAGTPSIIWTQQH